MSSTTFLQVQGLRKSFGGVAALDNANIEVSSGEVHALIGENGAGKSTPVITALMQDRSSWTVRKFSPEVSLHLKPQV